MMTPESLPDQYVKETIGIPIEIISNEFNDFMGNIVNSQKIRVAWKNCGTK